MQLVYKPMITAADFISALKAEPFYTLIQQRYEGKIARRSGVSYMNHIHEGAFILHLLYGGDKKLIEAYCLHPIFQSDKLLSQLLVESESDLAKISPDIVVLGMEYRRVANSYTLKHKIRSPESIDIGPLETVHRMLVADKIQNKKDFMRYLYQKHERPSYQRVSQHSVQYFDSWLKCLGVTEEMYESVVEKVEQRQLDNEVIG